MQTHVMFGFNYGKVARFTIINKRKFLQKTELDSQRTSLGIQTNLSSLFLMALKEVPLGYHVKNSFIVDSHLM